VPSKPDLPRLPAASAFIVVLSWLMNLHHPPFTSVHAAGRDIYAPDPPVRRAFGKALALLLPASMAGVLLWGFANPDEQRMFSATSPRQVPVTGEEIVNWSATHSVQPK
jgi:hypothetical protein